METRTVSYRSLLTASKASLFLIVTVSLALRVYGLGKESLWLDEITSVTRSQLPLNELMRALSAVGWNPLFEVFLHYWVKVFGVSEISVRWPSVIFGTASVFVLYRVGTLLFNERSGVLSALLLSSASFHLYYSREARAYALFGILALLSMYYFLRLIREPSSGAVARYLIWSSLTLYSHPLSPLVLIAQNAYVVSGWLFPLGRVKMEWKKWPWSQLLLFLIYFPWLRITLNKASSMQEAGGVFLGVPAAGEMLQVLKAYSGGSAIVCVLLTGIAVLSLKIRSIDGGGGQHEAGHQLMLRIDTAELSNVYLLFLWLVVPIVGLFVISRISAPIFLSRYTIPAVFAFYLLVGHGVDNVDRRYQRIGVTCLVAVLLLVTSLPIYGKTNKEQWRDVVAYVEGHARAGDLVLFHAPFCQKAFDFYSREEKGVLKQGFPQRTSASARLPISEESLGELSEVVDGYTRVWFVLSHSRDRDGLIMGYLTKSYDVKYEGDYFFIKLYLLEKRMECIRMNSTSGDGRVTDRRLQ